MRHKTMKLSDRKALLSLMVFLLCAQRFPAAAEETVKVRYPDVSSYTHNGELVHVFPDSPYLRKRAPLIVNVPHTLSARDESQYGELEPAAGSQSKEDLISLPTLSQLKSGQAKEVQATEPAIPALTQGVEANSAPAAKPEPAPAPSPAPTAAAPVVPPAPSPAAAPTEPAPLLKNLISSEGPTKVAPPASSDAKPAATVQDTPAEKKETLAPLTQLSNSPEKTEEKPSITMKKAAEAKPAKPKKTQQAKKSPAPKPAEEVKALPEAALPAGYKPSVGPGLSAPPVKPLTPLQSQSVAPAPTTQATGLAGGSAAAPLSDESQRILSRLPSNLDAPKSAPKPKPVRLERTPALDEIFPEIGRFSDESKKLGIDIVKVKKPDVNVNYELDKAYNALVAGHSDAAIDIYQKILQSEPNNTMALFGLATTFHRKGQLTLARPLYGKLLAIEPTHREALNNFLALVGEESPEQALGQLARLEETNPDFSPVAAQMAIIYQKLGELDMAKEKMRRAITLSPENMIYRYNLAVMLDKSGNYAEAAELYKQLITAYERGENISVNVDKIQERLTFIRSNKTRS